MLVQNLLLFLILVTLVTYVFMPWKDKKGKFMKPEFKTIIIWWISSFVIIGLFLYLIGSIIFT